MSASLQVLELFLFAGGFLVVGVTAGLVVYHLCLGWFISRSSKEMLDHAVRNAERHLLRRAERRHRRERRARQLAEATAGSTPGPPAEPAGRHLRQ